MRSVRHEEVHKRSGRFHAQFQLSTLNMVSTTVYASLFVLAALFLGSAYAGGMGFCGDGIVTPPEECDPPGLFCSSTCKKRKIIVIFDPHFPGSINLLTSAGQVETELFGSISIGEDGADHLHLTGETEETGSFSFSLASSSATVFSDTSVSVHGVAFGQNEYDFPFENITGSEPWEVPSTSYDFTFQSTSVSDEQVTGSLILTGGSGHIISAFINLLFEVKDAPRPEPCPKERRCHKHTYCIQPVVVANNDGTAPTACPSFMSTTNVWEKCCIDITVNAALTVRDTSLKDLHMDTTRMTAETRALSRLHRVRDCFEVYCVNRFTSDAAGTMPDANIWGGAVTYGTSFAVVQHDTDATIVAHEVGHGLGLGHSAGNVMAPTADNSTPNNEKVTLAQCKTAAGNASLKRPLEDCCKAPDA